MTANWLYRRLNVHVGLNDAELMAELDAYADAHVVGGAGALTETHRAAIRREHADAFLLYATVVRGHCSHQPRPHEALGPSTGRVAKSGNHQEDR